MDNSISLYDVIKEAVDSGAGGIFTAIVARVEAYTPGSQTIDAKPMVKMPLRDTDDNLLFDELPVITNVPVMWPSGGGFSMSLPLAAGDFVVLVFMQWDISVWRDTGTLSEPDNVARHGIGYPVAFPGARPKANALTSPSASNAFFGKDGADQQVVVDGSFVSVGRGASDFAALASEVNSNFNAIKSMFASWTPVPMDGGAALKALTASLSFSDVKATIAKVK